MSHERSDALPAIGTQSGAGADVEFAKGSTHVEEPVRNRGLVFAIVAMALFMAAVDGTIVATALSTIQHELGAGIEWSGWIITIYALGQILIMPLAGKLADMYGRKRVFLLAAVLFTAASLCCGLAGNIYVLVAL
ncbi:MAG TPA: MFS transporter, partial [Humibacter sp.]|nr:MFS transporter [Humibacter sp.]